MIYINRSKEICGVQCYPFKVFKVYPRQKTRHNFYLKRPLDPKILYDMAEYPII